MPISEKIMNKIKLSGANYSEQELMLKILRIEDRGTFRYQTEYEAIIKKYVDEHKEELK